MDTAGPEALAASWTRRTFRIQWSDRSSSDIEQTTDPDDGSKAKAQARGKEEGPNHLHSR